MPQRIQKLSRRLADTYPGYVTGIGINRKITPPKVGTHRRKTDLVHGGTEVLVLVGFTSGLTERKPKTVDELRRHLSSRVHLDGLPLHPKAFLIFGVGNKTLHGSRCIV